MGVRGLESFVRQEVPGGCVPVDMGEEIRKYFRLASGPDPPAPIIVIDLISLYTPLSEHDRKGLLFGGRFNLAYTVIDSFFTKLTNLGARLEFFYHGSMLEAKNQQWCKRQDLRYEEMLKLIDDVEQEMDLETVSCRKDMSLNFRYPLRRVAKKYGDLRVCMKKDRDQEMAAFAAKNNVMAIVVTDSNFLIYEGSWRYWFARDLDLIKLTTLEYDRIALTKHLRLERDQMPLLATLCGNDIMPFDISIENFRCLTGSIPERFLNVTQFLREHGFAVGRNLEVESLLKLATGRSVIDTSLIERFQQSLDSYKTDFKPAIEDPIEDPVLAILQTEDSSFMYKIWQGIQVNVAIGIVDMRRTEFEQQYADLILTLILRIASVVLYHRKPQPKNCEIAIKLNHDDPHETISLPVQFPTDDIVPPELPDLLSKDPDIHASLVDTKFKLLNWIALNKLDHHRKLQSVPKQLQMTVFTLCYLLEAKALKLFEADLLLQVAFDVIYETYDLQNLKYPKRLASRPFRLVFLYQKVYSFVWKTFRAVGLDHEEFRDDPPFDGVLFHRRYEDWSQQRGDLEQIRKWRIYQPKSEAEALGQK